MDRLDYKKIFEDNLEKLINLLQIPSVYDENSVSEKMPYGQYVHKAFEYMQDLAKKDNFETINYDNQALAIIYGKGKERIDIACHLDVVAAEEAGFDIKIKDKKIYGRGTSDMKVPTFLTYICLKLLREKYPNINKEIRLVLGTDEERTMNDMKHYVKKAGYPNFAYTPDGQFPLGIGEKGAAMWTITGDYSGIVESINAGIQCNVVPPSAKAYLNTTDVELVKKYIQKKKMDGYARLEDGRVYINIHGKAAHASVPFLGHSATLDLLELIGDLFNDELAKNLYKTYKNCFGKGFDSFVSVSQNKSLTCNLGILKIKDGKVFGQVDCRYPMSANINVVTEKLKKVSDLNVSLDYNDDPTLCDINDPYIKTMLDTYRSITGDKSKPKISDGVSYSKVFKHCVSFGPDGDKYPHLAHQKGEYVNIDDCLEWFELYYNVLEKLILLEV